MRSTLALVLCLTAGAAAAQPLPPDAPVPLAEPSLSPVEPAQARFDRFSAAAGPRIGVEALAATAGALVGVGGSLALTTLACNGVEGDLSCNLYLVFGPPGAMFLPSIGVFVAGAYYEGAGGYWLSVAGSTTGWLTAVAIFAIANPQEPGAAAALAIGLTLLPVSGAVAGYELASLRTLARALPTPFAPSRVTLAPWFDPKGGKGVSLLAAF
jgi:hypothetical protein